MLAGPVPYPAEDEKSRPAVRASMWIYPSAKFRVLKARRWSRDGKCGQLEKLLAFVEELVGWDGEI